jgi:hypothetical protein
MLVAACAANIMKSNTQKARQLAYTSELASRVNRLFLLTLGWSEERRQIHNRVGTAVALSTADIKPASGLYSDAHHVY